MIHHGGFSYESIQSMTLLDLAYYYQAFGEMKEEEKEEQEAQELQGR